MKSFGSAHHFPPSQLHLHPSASSMGALCSSLLPTLIHVFLTIQYQFKSTTEHFLPLDSTGLHEFLRKSKKIPTKASSASCCPIEFLPVGTISRHHWHNWSTPGSQHLPGTFSTPCKGLSEQPSAGMFVQTCVFTVSTHIREQTH